MNKRDFMLDAEVCTPGGGIFNLQEMCERGGCRAEYVIELVDYGIIAPVANAPQACFWQFDLRAYERLRKAQRLQRDLSINLPGLAMSLELLDELMAMRRQVARLQQQLARLSSD